MGRFLKLYIVLLLLDFYTGFDIQARGKEFVDLSSGEYLEKKKLKSEIELENETQEEIILENIIQKRKAERDENLGANFTSTDFSTTIDDNSQDGSFQAGEVDEGNFTTRKNSTEQLRSLKDLTKSKVDKHKNRPICLLEADEIYYAKRDMRLNFKGTGKCPYVVPGNETLIRKPTKYQRGLHSNIVYFNITSTGIYIIELSLQVYHDRYRTFDVHIKGGHNKKGILAQFELTVNSYHTVQTILAFQEGDIFFVKSETPGTSFVMSKMKIFKLYPE